MTSALPAGCQIAFGQTRHTRLRPARRQFSYRSFFVRVPMHELAGQRRGNPLFALNRWALLSLDERDHGDGRRGSAWLAGALAQAGIEAPAQVWLHAFPRVFGHAFKPVSFWFCHRHDGSMSAVIVEVNNTFGERHCYLLTPADGASIRSGQLLRARKSFHVSPFCAVQGGYEFRFLHAGARHCARIDHGDDAGPLLLTSLSGRLEPLGVRAALRALLCYPLFTVAVIARIHWQAFRLWRAKVPFHRKPEEPASFVTRGLP